jgi:hypothetical protein
LRMSPQVLWSPMLVCSRQQISALRSGGYWRLPAECMLRKMNLVWQERYAYHS